jgi:heat shock protein HslJ
MSVMTVRRRLLVLAVVAVGGLAVSACVHPGPPGHGPGGSGPPGHGTRPHPTRPGSTTTSTRPSTAGPVGAWRVTQYFDLEAGELTETLPDAPITLSFNADGNYGGEACNSYGGKWSVDGGSITLTDFVTTLRLCSPQEISDQEAAYYALLSGPNGRPRVDTWEVSDGTLTLSSGRGDRALIVAEPADPTPIPVEGPSGSWNVTAIMGPADRPEPLLPGTSISLTFGPGSRLSGRACNSYFAEWSTPGDDSIRIGPIGATRMACSEPAGVMEQEAAYFQALESATRWRIEGDTLTLSHPRGPAVIAERARS